MQPHCSLVHHSLPYSDTDNSSPNTHSTFNGLTSQMNYIPSTELKHRANPQDLILIVKILKDNNSENLHNAIFPSSKVVITESDHRVLMDKPLRLCTFSEKKIQHNRYFPCLTQRHFRKWKQPRRFRGRLLFKRRRRDSYHRQQRRRRRISSRKRLLSSTVTTTTTTTSTAMTTTTTTPLMMARLPTIFRLPSEVLHYIPKHLSSPKDLYNLSITSKAFQDVCKDERLWYNLHIQRIFYWSGDTAFGHIGQGTDIIQPWRRNVLDDYMRDINYSLATNDTIAMSDRLYSASYSNWKIDLCHSHVILPKHLGPATEPSIPSNPPNYYLNGSAKWRNSCPPVSYTDPQTQFTITAYLQAQSTLAYNGEQQITYQVVLYNLHNHDTPLAIIPGSLWSDSNRTNLQRPVNTRPMICQLMDIRRYRHKKDKLGRTRVLFVLAFGERLPANANATVGASGEVEMELLDVWTQGKIVEVYIYDSPLATSSPGDSPIAPYWGRVQHIDPSPQHPTLIRGRAIKLYTIHDPETHQEEDRVALFGIHHDIGYSNIVMLTGPVFPASAPSSSPFMDTTESSSLCLRVPPTIRHVTQRLHTAWSPYFIGSPEISRTTSMTLFPAHSDFEHLIVIIDKRGIGEIWDWINRTKVASLIIAKDSRIEKYPLLRQNLYFWGVQVNWTVEDPARSAVSWVEDKNQMEIVRERPLFRKHGDFRIICLADGKDSEWEVIRWDIKETDLRKQQSGDPLMRDWTVESRGRHYEVCTMGETHISSCSKSVSAPDYTPMQSQLEPRPLLFIAFLIWEHYRVCLTSTYGLCVFDMNKEYSEDILTLDESRPPLWVTDLENSIHNPLLDISTAGEYLVLTRRFSHILCPFRKVVQFR